MTPFNLIHLRLFNQGISIIKFTKPEEVVGWLGVVQAQDYLGSLWAAGLRIKDSTEKMIMQALDDRTIIRTWLNRGTLHYAAAGDVRWMLELLAPRIIANNASRLRKNYDLDDDVIAKSRTVLTQELQGGSRLSRSAMYETLEKAKISTVRTRGLHILWRLALEGLICFGPRQGKQPAFVLLDEWMPDSKMLERNDALGEMAARYFTSHGPATLHDFAWWSGLTNSDAQAGLEMAKPNLASETIVNQDYWFSDGKGNKKNVMPDVYLLPPFDEYLVAYADRKEILDSTYIGRSDFINSYANPTIIVNGRIAGTWKRTIKKDGVEVWLNPFIVLSDEEKSILNMAARYYGGFLGLKVLN